MAKSPQLSQEVKGFLDEANAASDPARTAWLAFLLLLTYVVVTLASVSHKDLLLNSPVRLPIIMRTFLSSASFNTRRRCCCWCTCRS
jgi:hypothetical protein